MNITVLRGKLLADPHVTELAGGSVVHNFELATTVADDRHVVPIAWHDPPRRPHLHRDDEAVVVGVVRRRWFRAGGGSQSRTEVLASVVARPGSEGARKAVVAAVDELGGSGPFG
jgi:single-strand DNA-binding protein